MQALLGRVPRHVMDASLGRDVLDERYEEGCRQLVERAWSASHEICRALEEQCPELSALEEAGYSNRIRYLPAVACVAAGVDRTLETDEDLDVLRYLRNVHRVAQERHEGATYDLSNVLGPLRFLPRVGHSRDDVLGMWIWLNLGDAGDHRHLTWVKSSMRFASGYGSEILRRFGTDPERDEGRTDEDETAGEVSRERARRIAEDHVNNNNVPGATGEVYTVKGWTDMDGRPPLVYGYDEDFWRSHWVAYLEQAGMGVRPSLIIAVHRETGTISYVGRANDEG